MVAERGCCIAHQHISCLFFQFVFFSSLLLFDMSTNQNNKAKSDGDLSSVLLRLSNAITSMNVSTIRTTLAEAETKVTSSVWKFTQMLNTSYLHVWSLIGWWIAWHHVIKSSPWKISPMHWWKRMKRINHQREMINRI